MYNKGQVIFLGYCNAKFIHIPSSSLISTTHLAVSLSTSWPKLDDWLPNSANLIIQGWWYEHKSYWEILTEFAPWQVRQLWLCQAVPLNHYIKQHLLVILKLTFQLHFLVIPTTRWNRGTRVADLLKCNQHCYAHNGSCDYSNTKWSLIGMKRPPLQLPLAPSLILASFSPLFYQSCSTCAGVWLRICCEYFMSGLYLLPQSGHKIN